MTLDKNDATQAEPETNEEEHEPVCSTVERIAAGYVRYCSVNGWTSGSIVSGQG